MSDDSTPPSSRRSGEWPEWAAILLDETQSTGRKVDRLTGDFAKHVGEDMVLKRDVEQLREERKEARSASMAWKVGLTAALLSAIALPIIEMLTRH